MTFREGDDQLSEKEIELLREMIRSYDRAVWLRSQLRWWLLWLLGVPAAFVSLWQAFDVINKMVHK